MSLKSLRLLIVDNDTDTRNLLSILFELEGAEIIAAASVKEAIDAISHVKPDVLITDIYMPDEDGYSLLSKIKNIEAIKEIPAIALTASARKEDVVKALALGFRKYLCKPVDLEELMSVVANIAINNPRTGDCLNAA